MTLTTFNFGYKSNYMSTMTSSSHINRPTIIILVMIIIVIILVIIGARVEALTPPHYLSVFSLCGKPLRLDRAALSPSRRRAGGGQPRARGARGEPLLGARRVVAPATGGSDTCRIPLDRRAVARRAEARCRPQCGARLPRGRARGADWRADARAECHPARRAAGARTALRHAPFLQL